MSKNHKKTHLNACPASTQTSFVLPSARSSPPGCERALGRSVFLLCESPVWCVCCVRTSSVWKKVREPVRRCMRCSRPWGHGARWCHGTPIRARASQSRHHGAPFDYDHFGARATTSSCSIATARRGQLLVSDPDDVPRHLATTNAFPTTYSCLA